MSSSRSRVDIYGAGIAGLVAAIHLAREGLEVHLFDSQIRIGGNQHWHPSVQTTILQLEKTEQYIGLDLADCFRRVNQITFYRYGRKKTFALDNMYVCERGPGKTSLDTRLHEQAVALGVHDHFSTQFSYPQPESGSNVILATGLDAQVYQQFGIPFVPIYGYRGITRTERGAILISYMSRCTNYDFAYLAADHGLLFALLFSRQRLADASLGEFQQLLKSTEGIQITRWAFSTGAIPTGPRLFYKGYVLTGTLSGMIDPFLLHGISGALTSGKIAARAFLDRQEAIREFRYLTRNFELKKALKALSVRLPFKATTLPLMMWIDSHLCGVGFIK